MGQTDHYHIPWPDGPVAADGPDALEDIARATEAGLAQTITEPLAQPFTPSWVVDSWAGETFDGPGPAVEPSIGNGLKKGYYSIRNGWCTFSATIWFGSTTSGGRGALFVGLPVPASQYLHQQGLCQLWIPGRACLLGVLAISPSSSLGHPWLPAHLDDGARLAFWRNCAHDGSPVSGQPFVDNSTYNVLATSGGGVFMDGRNGNISYSGTYLTDV